MPLQDGLRLRYLAEISEIQSIYTRLLPDRHLRFVYYQGDDPVFGKPTVLDHDIGFEPHHLSAEFLGQEQLPAPFAHARPATVLISIPRPATPGEWETAEASWSPSNGKLATIFARAPLVYEWLRYKVEMRRKAQALTHHEWSQLGCSDGSALLAPVAADDRTTLPETAADTPRPAILIGTHWLEVGGAEKMAFDTIEWALKAGLRVFVVASVPGLQRMAKRLPDHPDVQFIRLDRYLAHAHWPQYLARLVQDEHIRLLHIHHCVPLYAALAHLRVHCPDLRVIDTTHIVEHGDGGYPRISGVWSNYIDMHHVISGELRDFFRDRFHELHKVRLGRMLDRRRGVGALGDANMAAKAQTLRIAIVGRMVYQKRPIVTVEALRAVSKWAAAKGVTLQVTWVGEGPMLRAVQGLLNRYGLSEQVTLQGAGSDVPALFAQSDILLLPSNNEGLALVCYEAVEQGCIPISTDVGSQAEIVPPELLLPLSPPQTVKAFVAHVERLWSDADFLARQVQQMQQAYHRLADDPTAEDILMPIYTAVAEDRDPEL
ncbi:hypothetical protein BFP70_05295 [Thioclava sp. SK-1]|uniref:glycosyltransferase n=1 Tax=Thioclava sp. SK-1 TaxID=1889770 RepID=UPI00082424E5|nr:glycosyltransferase [Thioclava sp. SK-1]OCX66436.1 hypothetical protein BFP70_05295 [Thioclava sp. SK-1]